jgi:hypothetical protein
LLQDKLKKANEEKKKKEEKEKLEQEKKKMESQRFNQIHEDKDSEVPALK